MYEFSESRKVKCFGMGNGSACTVNRRWILTEDLHTDMSEARALTFADEVKRCFVDV